MNSIQKKIDKFFSGDALRVALVLVFSMLYLPHVWIVNEDINLITAFEVDPGSMFTAIDDLFRAGAPYNMMNGFHSRYYGWSFDALCYLMYAPFHYVMGLSGFGDNSTRYLIYRFTFFLVGLFFTIIFYEFIKKIAPAIGRTLALLLCLVFILSPVATMFYFIHPESTGALFFISSLIFTYNYIHNPVRINFYLACIFICLSIMAKQVFIFANFPTFLLLCYLMLKTEKIDRFQVLLIAFFLCTLTAFIIHPYAFMQPKIFIGYQIELLKHFSGTSENITFLDSVYRWLAVLKYSKIYYIYFLYLMPFSFLLNAYLLIKSKYNIYLLNLFINFTTILLFLATAHGNRLYFTSNYLIPLYIVLFISLVSFLSILLKSSFRSIKYFALIAIIFMFISGVVDSSKTLINLAERLNYKKSIAFRSFEFTSALYKKSSDVKIAHDHMVAIPYEFNSRSCHYWRGCGSDYIEQFKPTHVILTRAPSLGQSESYLRLKRYISDNKMIKSDMITGADFNIVDSEVAGGSGQIIDVYKLP